MGRRRLRRFVGWGAFVLLAWAALCHFAVRPAAESWLAGRMRGESRVRFAVLWPWLDLDAFSARVTADEHEIAASRVTVSFSPWGLVGGKPVSRVHLHDVRAVLEDGTGIDLFRQSHARAKAEGRGRENLDPARLPRFLFHGLEITTRDGNRLFAAAESTLEQAAAADYRLESRDGRLAGIPFDHAHARVLPRGTSWLVDRLRLYTFHGLIAGYLESRSGVVNGELRVHEAEVSEVWSSYGLPEADRRRGTIDGRVIFSGPKATLDALVGKGTLRLSDGNFFSPISMRVLLLLKVPVPEPSVFHTAEAEFSFESGRIYLEAAHVRGTSFDLDAQGIVTYGGHADLEVTHGSTTVTVRGPIEEPDVGVLPFNAVTRPFDRLFRPDLPDR